MLHRLLPLCLAAALAVPACGGGDVEATHSAPARSCPSVDAYLDGVYALVEAGKLGAVRSLLEAELTDDERADLVTAAIRLVGAFEPGTFAALSALSGAVESSGDLQATLGRVLRWLAEDGPRAPYPAALGRVRVLLQTCDLPATLHLLDTISRDEALQRALVELLGTVDLGELLGGVEIDGETGRPAVLALARNLLVAATSPDFDIGAVVGLLELVVDVEVAPWPALTSALDRLLGPGPSRAAVQELATCVLVVDEDLELVGLLFDLLTDARLDLLGDLTLPAGTEADEPLLPPSLAAPLHAALVFLADDAPARRSLLAVVTAALRDDVAPAVLRDLADLLEARIVGDVVELLAALATRSCPP